MTGIKVVVLTLKRELKKKKNPASYIYLAGSDNELFSLLSKVPKVFALTTFPQASTKEGKKKKRCTVQKMTFLIFANDLAVYTKIQRGLQIIPELK